MGCRLLRTAVFVPLLLLLCIGQLGAGKSSTASKPKAKAAKSAKSKAANQSESVRNQTPFLVLVYIGGVRAGWIRPFRTVKFSGLQGGYHEFYVTTQYASTSWGPEQVLVPGTWNVTPPEVAADEDLEVALASRIYRQNRNSLVACDRLAERRGETTTGLRADFEVKVAVEGKGEATVQGESLSKRLRDCYRAVAHSWQYPSTGSAYTVSFQHLP